MSILADRLGIMSGPVAWVAGLDLNNVGFAIVGLFVLAWVVALLVWRVGRIEEKWEAGLVGVDARTEAELERELDLSLDRELATEPL